MNCRSIDMSFVRFNLDDIFLKEKQDDKSAFAG